MYTIKEKLIALVLAASLPLAAILGGIGLYNISRLETMRAAETMNFIAEEATVKLDKIFIRAEDVVHHVASAVRNNVTSPYDLKDKHVRDKLKIYLQSLFNDAATSIDQILTYYVYFNPKLSIQNDGFWYIKEKTGNFSSHELTIVQDYGHNIGRTAWYYEPVKANHAVWLPPYTNENINERMISYAMPVKINGEIVAVVGIDIKFSTLTDVVKKIKVLDSGYGFLVKKIGDGVIYVHPDFPDGIIHKTKPIEIQTNKELANKNSTEGKLISFTYKGKLREMAFNTIRNGMKIAVSAPHAETYVTRSKAIFDTMLSVVLSTAIVIFVASFFAKRISSPLKRIKEASKRLSSGDYDFEIEKKANDEVGELTDSMNETIRRMRSYVQTITKMAYRDELTGVKNKSSYDKKTELLDKVIKEHTADFAVVMIDLNNLKKINDTYGHEKGNLAIIKNCQTICNIFKHSPVYRIGGDEFVVILEQADLINKDSLMHQLYEFVKDPCPDGNNPWDYAFLAAGCAAFRKNEDEDYLSVFRRADERMYECKKKQKGENCR